MAKKENTGILYRIAGPVVMAKNLQARMYDVVYVGKERLMGEVIQVNKDLVTIQVYEDTSGLKPGEEVENSGQPLTVELGPGLLTSIYDGIQRPLPVLQKKQGDYILRGAHAAGLNQEKKWEFMPLVKKGDIVGPGSILGEVEETPGNFHKILVPPTAKPSTIKEIMKGKYTVNDTIAILDDGTKLTMKQYWPVRKPRPIREKLAPTVPLITGQRI
ncbi:MAG: V-type ATP synthase subunit A, partial [Candidatus Woesearchaeota archaeon]